MNGWCILSFCSEPHVKTCMHDKWGAHTNIAHAPRIDLPYRFAELASLIDPGKEPKTDKPTILADAIKYVHQMRVENHQLKQLNKFLEERVAQLERERGQTLYQHSLMMQHGGMMMPPMQGKCEQGSWPRHSQAGQFTNTLPATSTCIPHKLGSNCFQPHLMT